MYEFSLLIIGIFTGFALKLVLDAWLENRSYRKRGKYYPFEKKKGNK